LASALLNVGQQVGGALGLSVMTTVFGTSARNYVNGHSADLYRPLGQLPGNLPDVVGARVQQAGQNGLQPADVDKFVHALPPASQGQVRSFFDGPYKDFTHSLLAHASGMGFFAGAMFGVAALIAAITLINVRKEDLPAEELEGAEPVLVG
jgi:hypothetical protein